MIHVPLLLATKSFSARLVSFALSSYIREYWPLAGSKGLKDRDGNSNIN